MEIHTYFPKKLLHPPSLTFFIKGATITYFKVFRFVVEQRGTMIYLTTYNSQY